MIHKIQKQLNKKKRKKYTFYVNIEKFINRPLEN